MYKVIHIPNRAPSEKEERTVKATNPQENINDCNKENNFRMEKDFYHVSRPKQYDSDMEDQEQFVTKDLNPDVIPLRQYLYGKLFGQ